MFDDVRFYTKLAENSKSYGRAKCSDSTLFLAVSQLDFDDDLLDAMESPDAYLLGEAARLAA